jgi:hypothetical protein
MGASPKINEGRVHPHPEPFENRPHQSLRSASRCLFESQSSLGENRNYDIMKVTLHARGKILLLTMSGRREAISLRCARH